MKSFEKVERIWGYNPFRWESQIERKSINKKMIFITTINGGEEYTEVFKFHKKTPTHYELKNIATDEIVRVI